MFARVPFSTSKILLAASVIALILVSTAAAESRKTVSDGPRNATLGGVNANNDKASVIDASFWPEISSQIFGAVSPLKTVKQYRHEILVSRRSPAFSELKNLARRLEGALDTLQEQAVLPWTTVFDVEAIRDIPPGSHERLPLLSAAHDSLCYARQALLNRNATQAKLDIGQAKYYLTIYEYLLPAALWPFQFETTPAIYLAKKQSNDGAGIKPMNREESSGRRIERQASGLRWWSNLTGRFKKPL